MAKEKELETQQPVQPEKLEKAIGTARSQDVVTHNTITDTAPPPPTRPQPDDGESQGPEGDEP